MYLGVNTRQYFVSLSYMFEDKKTVLKIRLNLGLKLTIFRGTGPDVGVRVQQFLKKGPLVSKEFTFRFCRFA